MTAGARDGGGVGWGVRVRGMGYAQGGGLTVRARARRETVRFEAAGMPVAEMASGRVVARLWVY